MRPTSEEARVARYFDRHAEDFDSIYASEKSALRRVRDRLSRGTVVQRLAFVLDLASRLRPASVLDVGCGSGRFAIPLAMAGARVVGLDMADHMLEIARARAREADVAERCEFVNADFLQWESSDRFEVSLGIGLFDYVPEPNALLAKMCVATSGTVVASFPQRFHPLVPLRAIRLRASDCPVFFYTRSHVEALAREHLARFDVTVLGRDYMLVGEPRPSD